MACVTLLSDLGLQSTSVATTKGALLRYAPNTEIVDISHNIEPFHLQQAAYLHAATFRKFPDKSSHLILFDVFYEETPQLLLAQVDNQYILTPDNGILPLSLRRIPEQVWKCYELTTNDNFETWVTQAAQIVEQLKNKTPEQLNLPEHDVRNAPNHCTPNIYDDIIEGQVIHIDRFENVVLNITRDEFEKARNGRSFYISFMRDEVINEISTHYSSVRESKKLCRFNNAGYLEIAINRGNAAGLFGLRMVREKQQIYNTIKIHFE